MTLKEENELLRKTVRFYARAANWRSCYGPHGGMTVETGPALRDNGYRATKALEKIDGKPKKKR